MKNTSKLDSAICKIGETEYLTIKLDASLRLTLQTLSSAKFSMSTRDIIFESLEYSKMRLGNRSSEFSTPNNDAMATEIRLSMRQKQLLPMLHQGLSNREIALHLNISEHTVKVHLWRFYKKLNVRSRFKLVSIAKLNGWL